MGKIASYSPSDEFNVSSGEQQNPDSESMFALLCFLSGLLASSLESLKLKKKTKSKRAA